jgi:probable HAF family extracellular repeat protein
VVGRFTSGDNTRGFVYTSSGFTEIGTFGGQNSMAVAINDHGQVVGSAATASGCNHAFLFAGGTLHDLGTLGGSYSEAYDINNQGVIVGISAKPDAPNFVFRQGFRYAGGSMRALGTLPDGAASEGMDTFPEFPSHAVLYRNGSFELLVPLGYGDSAVYGLNDRGQAVGGIPNTTSAHGSHAFLYDRRGGMVDLNTLIDPDGGWVITDANAINDAGQIAATACRGGVFSDCHAVRLDLVSPVPEPGGWAMLALGIGAIGLRGASRLRRPC